MLVSQRTIFLPTGFFVGYSLEHMPDVVDFATLTELATRRVACPADRNQWVYYRGGPKDEQVLLGTQEAGYLVFDGPRPWGYYQVTDETHATNHGPVPVAVYVGNKPPTP
jgi:hypothetical protein